jgi:hypothetical protein
MLRSEVFTAVTMNNASPGMLRGVAPVRNDVTEERSASIIRMTGSSEIGTTPE